MSISSFGSGSRTLLATDLFVSMRRDMVDLQRQLATQQKSATYGGLGFERRSSLDARGKLAAIAGYQATIEQADLRVRMMTQNLERIGKLGGDTRADLILSKFEPLSDGRTFAQKNAENRLKEMIDLLNSDMAGRYLFGGRVVDQMPVETYDRIMNGDGTRAGLKTLIKERTEAELGATGTGRLAVSSSPTAVQIAEEAALPDFGFKIASATATGTAITATTMPGPPPNADFALGSLPADGDTIRLTLTDLDGNAHVIELTARTTITPTSLTTSFQIGATVAATVANLNAALTAAVQEKATAVLQPRAAMRAATEFFEGSPSNPPQRVGGPTPATATGMVPGTALNTMIWYTGDDTASSARATVPVRVDSTQTVPTGAQANEPAIRTILAQLGVLAAETFPVNTPAQAARYNTLTDRVISKLSTGGGAPKVEEIITELATSANVMKAAKERHRDSELMLHDVLQSNELASQEEVAAAILNLQTRLQASYQTTSILSRLSLVNYL